MRTLLLISLMFLTACKSVPEKETVYETRVVTRLPPPELLVIPEKVEPIDIQTATEVDVARFLKEVWDRMVILENNIIGVSKFFENANQTEAKEDVSP